MVLSQDRGKAALDYVRRTLWQFEDDEPICGALSEAQLIGIGDILELPFGEIDCLTFTDCF